MAICLNKSCRMLDSYFFVAPFSDLQFSSHTHTYIYIYIYIILGFEVGRPGMAPQPIEYVGVSLPNSLSSFGVPMSPPIGIEPWVTFYLWAGGRGSVVTRGHFGSSVCGPWRGRHFDFPSRPCPLMTDHTLHAHVTDRPPTHVPCDDV